ncbi:MAG: PDZ domain-containing protein [Pirellulaceae bacterium]|nr:PDZ domain-containing protein [Pirellulaceae bacterium]
MLIKKSCLFVAALFAASVLLCETLSASDGAADRTQIEPAIAKVYPALVRIYVVSEEPSGGRMERQRSSGSGVIISPDGYVVTNHHVAGTAVRITCTLSDGEEVEAELIGTDPMSDLAVLKLKPAARKNPDKPLGIAQWGDSSKLKVGDVVLAMGSPMAVSQSVTRGIVSNVQMIMPKAMSGQFSLDGEDVGRIVRWIGHDAVIFGGNSGGPLVNLDGEIVGINEIGLGSLGGAIPSNLAKDVVRQLIDKGYVSRSWIGVNFQPRLKGDPNQSGALVASVVQGSPAEKAGIRAGDVVVRFNGQPVNADLPEHLPPLNQLLFSAPLGEVVEIVFIRDGREITAEVAAEPLQRALGEPHELKPWGIAVRDITRMMALERHRNDTRGVLVHSVRGGGGAATAKLPVRNEDIIVRVEGRPVEDVAALEAITAELLEGKTGRVPALVQLERNTEQLLTVVMIGEEENRNRPASASKPWSSMETQVLTPDLAEAIGMKGKSGVRVTDVFKDQAAERAGIKIGDVITAVNGGKVKASQPGDQDVFDTMIRRLRVGKKAKLEIVRDGETMEVEMNLEAAPADDRDAKSMKDADFEFSARELTYADRLRMRLPDEFKGVLLQKVENGGWASLGGLRGNDLLISIDGKAAPTVAELQAVLEEIRKAKPRHVVFFVRRGIHTLFCEIEPDYR